MGPNFLISLTKTASSFKLSQPILTNWDHRLPNTILGAKVSTETIVWSKVSQL